MPAKQPRSAKAAAAAPASSGPAPSVDDAQSRMGNAAVLGGIAQGSCEYEIQPGDTLSGISESYFGGDASWRDLYSANEESVGPDANRIRAGGQLNLCNDGLGEGVARSGADLGAMSEADADAARADRLAAREELAGRFEVVSDDFMGPRLPNQLTAAEFEEVANLYSDIRQGNTNINFDSTGSGQTADDFRDASMGDMASILTTGQGRQLMSQLAYQEVDGNDISTTIAYSATPEGAQAIIGPGGTLGDAVNGTGTNTGVQYQPGVDFDLGDVAPAYGPDGYAEMTSDVVLFHELVHANNARLGLLDGEIDPNTGAFTRPSIEDSEAAIRRDRGVPREEYSAVGIGEFGGDYTENGYRSERGLVTGSAVAERDNYNGSGP